MNLCFRIFGTLAIFLAGSFVSAQAPFTKVAGDVNNRMVKLFGAGGFKGLPSYGTGILVSSKGHILTANNHILTTVDLRVHLYDGRLYHAKVVAKEPELDVALVKIEEKVDNLPHFDFDAAAKRKLAEPGDWVLAFSNCFQIATRDEAMTVQRGVIAAYGELRGRRGVFEAPYTGEAYFVDAISNNPGSAGGALTTRKGELLGIVGRELKNTQSDTWINYAIPIQAKVEVQRDDKTETVTMAGFVKEAMEGTYKQGDRTKLARQDKGAYHGIVLVPNAVTNTPPYVEEVLPGSPAFSAGLQPDDLIVYVDGELCPSIKTFRELIAPMAPGTEIKLEVQRGTKLNSVKLKLAEQPKIK